MNRINSRQDFSIRLVFSDPEGRPLSMKDADFDLWFSTRQDGPVYFAAQRSAVCNNCRILDDGSVLVSLDNHRLPPGQLHTSLILHVDSHDMPDGVQDIHLSPVIPVEIIDGPACPHRPAGSGHHQTDNKIILVNIKVNLRHVDLRRHVTQTEINDIVAALNRKIDSITPCDMTVSDSIDDITSLFQI